MRLVTWNVCDDVARKIAHLERLGPDIAVLQEVRPDGLADAGLARRSIWIGDAGQKGLAVVAYNSWTLEPTAPVNERWFLPVCARRGGELLHVVGVWADSSRDCSPLTLRALDELHPFITFAAAVVAGDFNQTVRLDRGKGPTRRFATVLERLEGLGLASAWHAETAEEHGAEATATYYHRRNLGQPFHIDFAFSNLSAVHVELGSAETFLRVSDHMPLVVDYVLPGSAGALTDSAA